MSDFGLVMLFSKYMRGHVGRVRRSPHRMEARMAYMEKHEPGEWFKFLAWAAIEKAKRDELDNHCRHD